MSLMTELSEEIVFLRWQLKKLEKRGVITTDPEQADMCCGFGRDEDGFCRHRPGHPVYVSLEHRSEDT